MAAAPPLPEKALPAVPSLDADAGDTGQQVDYAFLVMAKR